MTYNKIRLIFIGLFAIAISSSFYSHPSESSRVLAQAETFSYNAVVGELIFESEGEIVNQRVIDHEYRNELPKIESSYSGNGYLNGVGNVTEIWTLVDTQMSSGITQGLGHGVITSTDGKGISTVTELGRGFLGEGGEMNYPGARFFTTQSSGKMAFLNQIVGLTHWEVDNSGNYFFKMWQ
jgi:hypothetical protein